MATVTTGTSDCATDTVLLLGEGVFLAFWRGLEGGDRCSIVDATDAENRIRFASGL